MSLGKVCYQSVYRENAGVALYGAEKTATMNMLAGTSKKKEHISMEFGEKIKKLREEKGMTQQTMAEQLYVTRQAVSRWECGARYPDLLTAKKIAQILEVSIDELVSGEELQKNIEREPILARPVENIFQTVLYTVAVVAYLLMCVFSAYSFLTLEKMAGTPAGEITLGTVAVTVGYVVNLIVLLLGLAWSVKNRLTAKRTGVIMAFPYVVEVLQFVCTMIEMAIKLNGSMTLIGGIVEWLTEFVIPLVFALCILLYFCDERKHIPYWVIWGICAVNLLEWTNMLRIWLPRATDLGFVVRMVHLLGKTGIVVLLGYQAYILHQKQKKGVKSVKE